LLYLICEFSFTCLVLCYSEPTYLISVRHNSYGARSLFDFFFQAEDGIRDRNVTGVQTCALPVYGGAIYSSGTSDTGAVDLRVTNAMFRNNIANDGKGGAIYTINNDVYLSDVIFDNNQAYRSEERRVGKERRDAGWT